MLVIRRFLRLLLVESEADEHLVEALHLCKLLFVDTTTQSWERKTGLTSFQRSSSARILPTKPLIVLNSSQVAVRFILRLSLIDSAMPSCIMVNEKCWSGSMAGQK